MQDNPDAHAILAEVEAALKAGIAPGLQQRMAANAVALARRELVDGSAGAERARLAKLLGKDAALQDLNHILAEAIRERRIGADTPGLIDHLWATTIDKMRVDQPAYPAFAAWRAEQEDGSTE